MDALWGVPLGILAVGLMGVLGLAAMARVAAVLNAVAAAGQTLLDLAAPVLPATVRERLRTGH
jgi:hypothetical protein